MTMPPPWSTPSDLPRWAWITLAVLVGLILLPLYFRWFGFAVGRCGLAALLELCCPLT